MSCPNYSADLNCGAGNFDSSKDECLRCSSVDVNFNYFDSVTKKCIKGSITNCLTYLSAKTC